MSTTRPKPKPKQEQEQEPPIPAEHGHGGRDGTYVGEAPHDSDLLSASPFQDDLDAELAARPSRARPAGLTLYLAVGVLLVAGFIGGVSADRFWGSGASSAATGPAAAGARGQTGRQPGTYGAGGPQAQGGGMTGGGMMGARMTVGTVQKISGKTVYVRTADGGLVKVMTNGSTKVRTTRNGTVRDLKSGASVVVQGAAGQDGTVTATTVNEGGGLNGSASSPRRG